MQGTHLRIVRHLIWISIGLKEKELDYLDCSILDSQMQETLAHYIKTVLYLTILRLCLEHFVHLDELIGLIMLNEL